MRDVSRKEEVENGRSGVRLLFLLCCSRATAA